MSCSRYGPRKLSTSILSKEHLVLLKPQEIEHNTPKRCSRHLLLLGVLLLGETTSKERVLVAVGPSSARDRLNKSSATRRRPLAVIAKGGMLRWSLAIRTALSSKLHLSRNLRRACNTLAYQACAETYFSIRYRQISQIAGT